MVYIDNIPLHDSIIIEIREDIEMNTIVQRLEEFRISRKMNITEFAEILGCQPGVYSRVRKGLARIPKKNLQAAANVLGISKEELTQAHLSEWGVQPKEKCRKPVLKPKSNIRARGSGGPSAYELEMNYFAAVLGSDRASVEALGCSLIREHIHTAVREGRMSITNPLVPDPFSLGNIPRKWGVA